MPAQVSNLDPCTAQALVCRPKQLSNETLTATPSVPPVVSCRRPIHR